MSSPSISQIQTSIADIVRILNDQWKNAQSNTPNFVASFDTAVDSYKGNFSSQRASGLSTLRASLSQLLAQGGVALAADLRDFGQLIKAPPTDDPLSIRPYLYQYFIDNSLYVKSRAITYDTASAGGSNVGNGLVSRLTVDENNLSIENCHAEYKAIICTADQSSGAQKHNEIFNIRGAGAPVDQLQYGKTSLNFPIKCLSMADVQLQNPSFSTWAGTSITALTSIPGWTVSSISNFNLDQTNYYDHNIDSDSTPASLKFITNASIYQLLSTNFVQINPSVPMYLQIAYNRSVGSGDGTITLTLGSQTVTVVLSAQSGWNILKIPIGQKNWYKTWKANGATVKIELTGRTTGTLLVDDVILAPMTQADGLWYALVGGETPFSLNDVFTLTDSETNPPVGINNYWFSRALGFYLPPTTSSTLITFADPS